ncbi:hypothetical protein EDC01DRAFT_665671 [Geopyxis carbonaria]|nr:hypothetical protein EDC01DRAFT_665671 [Geopyxis carbonaria]
MSTSVNVPTNRQQRDADIDNKLRLFGIYNAFSNGKLPSNRQIDVALSSFVNHDKIKNPNSKLSSEGRTILEDFRTVVQEAQRLLLVKNHDEALQEFIWNATQLGQQGGPGAAVPGAPVDKETANRDGQQGLAGLKTLGQLIITNGQFRKLLNDAVILLRDIAGDAASKSASKISPSEEHLRQIDDPAPDHVWHEAPDPAKLKQQLREKVNRNKPVDRNDIRDVAGNASQTADPNNSRDPRDAAARTARDQRNGTSSGVDMQNGLKAGATDLAQRTKEGIPEDKKQRAREYRERTQNYLKGKMPQERRDQTIWRLKKMVVEIQSHQDYSAAINTLLSLAETYSSHGKNVATQSSGAVKGARQDNYLKSAETNLKTIIERFANNTSADDLIDAINDIYRDADRDPELKNWFRSVDRYVRRCLKQEGYILEEDSTREYNQLYDHGNFLMRNRYRDHTDRLFDEFKFLGDQFAADPDNKRFGDSLQKLFKDLGNDASGKTVFKKDLIKDITQVIIPDIFEGIRYMPVPRIEYSDPQFDAIIENLVLESDNLMPNVLEIGNDSYFRFGRRNISNKNKQQFMVSASQIQCDLRDISYYVKRKQGFPSITDTGIVDVFLGGDGFGFKLQLGSAEKHDRANFFKVENVSVTIKHMNIKLRKSKHKLLFSIFRPLLLKVIKPVIVKVLEQQIRQTFSDLDALAYKIYQEEQKIEAELKANPDPENAQNIYARYYKAIQAELLSRKKKAEDKVADKKVNMAMTKQDSIFSDISLPGGISTKATTYKQQAAEGDRWHNDVFSLGSASPTASLAPAPEVTRKSPHARRRGVKERDTASAASRDSGYQGHENVPEFGNYGYADKIDGTGRYQPSTSTRTGSQGIMLNSGTNPAGLGY